MTEKEIYDKGYDGGFSDGIWVEEDSFNLMFFDNYCNVDTGKV